MNQSNQKTSKRNRRQRGQSYGITEDERIDYLRRNAQYLSRTAMAETLGVRQSAVEKVCRESGIELLPLGAPSRIPGGIEEPSDGVPEGFALNQWLRGTTIRYPTSTPGYVSVTRHIADDDDEDLDDQEKATEK